jgi:hypothetical protein
MVYNPEKVDHFRQHALPSFQILSCFSRSNEQREFLPAKKSNNFIKRRESVGALWS